MITEEQYQKAISDINAYQKQWRVPILKQAHELEFISQIKRDGSEVLKVPKKAIRSMCENKFSKDDYFQLTCLSLSNKTFIASGFNSYVVRLKESE